MGGECFLAWLHMLVVSWPWRQSAAEQPPQTTLWLGTPTVTLSRLLGKRLSSSCHNCVQPDVASQRCCER